MEIITHKCGDALMTTNIHGNRLELATPENIRTKMIAGTSQKDGQLYVFKKSTRIYPDIPVVNPGLEIDYVAEDEMTDFTYDHYKWLRRFLRRKKLSPLTQISLDYIQQQRKTSKQWLILTHFYGDKRYYFRWRLYWLRQDVLNKIFSIHPKGLLLDNEVDRQELITIRLGHSCARFIEAFEQISKDIHKVMALPDDIEISPIMPSTAAEIIYGTNVKYQVLFGNEPNKKANDVK